MQPRHDHEREDQRHDVRRDGGEAAQQDGDLGGLGALEHKRRLVLAVGGDAADARVDGTDQVQDRRRRQGRVARPTQPLLDPEQADVQQQQRGFGEVHGEGGRVETGDRGLGRVLSSLPLIAWK